MKDIGLRILGTLAFVALLAILCAVALYAFGWRPTVGVGS